MQLGRRWILAVVAGVVMLLSAGAALAAASKNAITNGMFSHGLKGWSTGRTAGGQVEVGNANNAAQGWSWMAKCAKFQGNKPFLAENVPQGASGYAQQTVKVPHDGVLKFRTWGNLDPVVATVGVITVSNHERHALLKIGRAHV